MLRIISQRISPKDYPDLVHLDEGMREWEEDNFFPVDGSSATQTATDSATTMKSRSGGGSDTQIKLTDIGKSVDDLRTKLKQLAEQLRQQGII